jgi:serine/threonine-protein kinase RsbW
VARPLAQGKLTIGSRLQEVTRVERAILEAVTQCGFGGADQFAIKLALEEALANAIKHGSSGNANKSVVIEFEVDEKRASISVQDEGGGFDPSDVPDPTLDENLEKPNGRGVMLMRTYMDKVIFSPAGNRVTMIKNRSAGD